MNDQAKQRDNTYWKEKLTAEQFAVCRLGSTEAPFTGRYYHHHEAGTYHCVACGQPLFSSDAKYESGSGWPSFWEAMNQENVELREDNSYGMRRTEVVCRSCGSHLGHIFDDGPPPTGVRYCINSVALQFEPSEKE